MYLLYLKFRELHGFLFLKFLLSLSKLYGSKQNIIGQIVRKVFLVIFIKWGQK